MSETEFEFETAAGYKGRPALLRLKRTRAKKQVGYLCLRATDRVDEWILTRNYHTPVFGFKGHEVWSGQGYEAGVAKLLEIVHAERLASIKEFQATIDHLNNCAAAEAAGLAFPPKGFRRGWARAKLPLARRGAALNDQHWVQNLAALKTRLQETSWPTSPVDSHLTPT